MTWTVASLLLAVADALSTRFGALSVRGELSSFTRAASGHCYLSLKDADGAPGLVRGVMFRRSASMLDFAPAEGQQVEVRGRLSVYEPRGELQMVIESLQRVGSGSLYEEFLRLRARLEAQGLFEPAGRQPIPAHPRALGVVTSLGAAALRDVLTTLRRRAPHLQVLIYPCLVQGAEAPASIVAALSQATERAEVDTLLLVRGGGSLEDLWAFNDERVVRAVAASKIPLVCGVGHETDVTLSDLAADLRAATPTAAAELAAPVRAELLLALSSAQAALQRSVQRSLDRQAQRLDGLAQRAGRPGAVLMGQAHRLDGLARRLDRALATRTRLAEQGLPTLARRMARTAAQGLLRRQDRLDALGARLQAAHPEQVLRRGYAWVVGADGVPVMRAAALQPGERIEAVFADGRAAATVDQVKLAPPQA